MSTHYLISAFDDQIRSVTVPNSLGKTEVTGNYVVKVPDDCVVRNPTSLADLLTQKYASMLASHGLFSSVVYDDCLDNTEVDFASSTAIQAGSGGSIMIYPDVGRLFSTSTSFVWGGGGAGPAQALLLWDLFLYEDTLVQGVLTRTYVEVPSSTTDIEAQVSFNGGTTWTYGTYGNLVNIDVADRGSDVSIKFANIAGSGPRIGLGSWAILF